MANDLNQCNFIGRLGADPETNYLPSGKAVCNFRIAVGSSWKNESGEKQEKTEWVPISVFGKLAEICGEYLTKGSQVYISGRFQTREYEKEGVKRYTTSIIAENMQMLGGKGGEKARTDTPKPAQGKAFDDDFDSEIPF